MSPRSLINLNSFALMPQWQHTARETSLAQVHEAPDPQFNISHTHSASLLLFQTREQFYSDVIMSSLSHSPGERRPAPHPPHITISHLPAPSKHGAIPTL